MELKKITIELTERQAGLLLEHMKALQINYHWQKRFNEANTIKEIKLEIEKGIRSEFDRNKKT